MKERIERERRDRDRDRDRDREREREERQREEEQKEERQREEKQIKERQRGIQNLSLTLTRERVRDVDWMLSCTEWLESSAADLCVSSRGSPEWT